MAFKINVSHKGRTWKTETDNEALIKLKIGDKIDGGLVSAELGGYELEIRGTSDIAGFPGIKGQAGPQLRGMLLTSGEKGMRNQKHDGLRLKKTLRGEEISDKTSQINLKVLKEGKKKFDEICPAKPPKEKPKAAAAEAPKAEAAKVEEKKTEAKAEAKAKEKPKEEKKEEKKEVKAEPVKAA